MKKRFGATLRAHRLGFHELASIGFVRIRADGPPWVVDVLPFDVKAEDVRSSGGEHVRWWDGPHRDIEEVLFRIVVKQCPHTLYLDDNGKPTETP